MSAVVVKVAVPVVAPAATVRFTAPLKATRLPATVSSKNVTVPVAAAGSRAVKVTLPPCTVDAAEVASVAVVVIRLTVWVKEALVVTR